LSCRIVAEPAIISAAATQTVATTPAAVLITFALTAAPQLQNLSPMRTIKKVHS
jgi:hypothetical protein